MLTHKGKSNQSVKSTILSKLASFTSLASSESAKGSICGYLPTAVAETLEYLTTANPKSGLSMDPSLWLLRSRR
jgi:hypothetical protein